jgi:hypothetical protein
MDYMSYIRAIRSSDLPVNAKITAIMIASHYDFSKGDPAWPSNNTLARETGLSVRSVIRAKNILSDRQYLVSHRQYNSVCEYIPCVPQSAPPCPNGNLNTHINTHINTNINTQINQTSFDNSFNLIDTGDVIDLSSKTIATGTALKELTPAEIDELLSW